MSNSLVMIYLWETPPRGVAPESRPRGQLQHNVFIIKLIRYRRPRDGCKTRRGGRTRRIGCRRAQAARRVRAGLMRGEDRLARARERGAELRRDAREEGAERVVRAGRRGARTGWRGPGNEWRNSGGARVDKRARSGWCGQGGEGQGRAQAARRVRAGLTRAMKTAESDSTARITTAETRFSSRKAPQSSWMGTYFTK